MSPKAIKAVVYEQLLASIYEDNASMGQAAAEGRPSSDRRLRGAARPISSLPLPEASRRGGWKSGVRAHGASRWLAQALSEAQVGSRRE